MREIWKQIKGFEGLYSVSNYGNVRRDKTHNKAGTGNYARVENLEWCSQKHNMNYGTCPYRIGKANSKIIAQFDKSGNFIKNYNSIIEAERQTNISNGTICDVLKGRRKSAGGFLWEYAQ